MLWNASGEHLYMAVREPDDFQGRIRQTQWSVWPTWESWNWPGWEGKDIEVEVYTKAASGNGELVGKKEVNRDTKFQAVFRLPYEPGTLKAVGLDEQGTERETRQLATAGEPYAVRITPDRTQLRSDGQDLAYLTLEVVDKAGHPCPLADNVLNVKVKGDARLEALCNADWRDLGSMRDEIHKVWKGRAQAIVRSGKKKGKATVMVASPSLKTSSLTIYLQGN